MFNLVLHTALLVLAAFILGAIFGCLLKRFLTNGNSYGTQTRSAPTPTPTPAQTAAAAATATVAASVAATTAKADAAAVTAKQDAEKEAAEEAVAQPAAEKAAAAQASEQPVAMDDAAAAAAIAALPADASNEEKANAVGTRPQGMAAPIAGKKDNLQRIKGIGKVNEGKLNDLGIYHFSQISAWSPSQARWVGTFLSFSGRIEREDWLGQAKVLAQGGETAFAKRVDKGEVSTSAKKKR
jgi:branched-chain amino acid transport system ATP-binding protein